MNKSPNGFPKTARILQRGEYRAVQRSALRVTTAHFVVYARKRRRDRVRLGITVSKKVGNAGVRNRVKRWVRESFRISQTLLPGTLDYVLVARRGKCPESLLQTTTEMLDAINRLDTLFSKKQRQGNVQC